MIDSNSHLLDCTLRDGSYEINFKFTKKNTEALCKNLEKAGFKYIEIGHGLGLGATRNTKFKAVESDKTYMKAASKSLRKAKWGMFCIPTFSSIDDLSIAADHGMNFVRIGTNLEDYKSAEPFVKKAKELNLFVCSNYMKTYLTSPKNFVKYAKFSKNIGSDLVYIVDSAGGMFPEELENYYKEIKFSKTNIKLGFHGHNNLGLAVANSLKAYDLGFSLIDTSLQGFGRSAGNVPAEQLICSFARKGIYLDINPIQVMDISEKFIFNLIKKKGFSPIETISGMSLFHSSYMPIIKKFSKKHDVDPRELIVAVCKISRSEAKSKIVEREAIKLKKKGYTGNWKKMYGNYYGQEQKKY